MTLGRRLLSDTDVRAVTGERRYLVNSRHLEFARPARQNDREKAVSVEKIELRATRLRAYDGRVMLVPNAEVFTSHIVNNTADPLPRAAIDLLLGYDVDVKRALEVIRAATLRASGVLEAPTPAVRIDDLRQDDIRVEITLWADSQRSDYKNTAAAVRAAILEDLIAAAIPLPDPAARTVRLKQSDASQS